MRIVKDLRADGPKEVNQSKSSPIECMEEAPLALCRGLSTLPDTMVCNSQSRVPIGLSSLAACGIKAVLKVRKSALWTDS